MRRSPVSLIVAAVVAVALVLGVRWIVTRNPGRNRGRRPTGPAASR